MSENVNRGRLAIVTPCHGIPLGITTRTEGSMFQTYQVPDEIYCSAPGCNNSWKEDGTPEEWNKDYPEAV